MAAACPSTLNDRPIYGVEGRRNKWWLFRSHTLSFNLANVWEHVCHWLRPTDHIRPVLRKYQKSRLALSAYYPMYKYTGTCIEHSHPTRLQRKLHSDIETWHTPMSHKSNDKATTTVACIHTHTHTHITYLNVLIRTYTQCHTCIYMYTCTKNACNNVSVYK